MAPAQTPSVSQSSSITYAGYLVVPDWSCADVQPLPIHTSFLSLPAEILAVIILHVDTPTTIALRRVSLHFSTLDIDQHLLHDLSLAVSDHEEGISLPNPSAQEIETAKAAEVAISQRLLAKTQAVLALLQLNPKLVSIVHNLTLVPRPNALSTIVESLKLVSPSIRSLRMLAPQSHPCDSHWPAGRKDNLDWALLSSGLRLPSLRSIEFGPRSTHYPGFVHYLCQRALNLSSVDIDASMPTLQYSVRVSKHPRYAIMPSHPQVKALQLCRKFPIANDIPSSLSTMRTMSAHLRQFSNVHSITIDLEPEDALVRLVQGVIFMLKGMSHLEALDMRGISHGNFFSALAGMPGGEGFAKLRRLVLGHVDWNSLVSPIPECHILRQRYPDQCSISTSGPCPKSRLSSSSISHPPQPNPSSKPPTFKR